MTELTIDRLTAGATLPPDREQTGGDRVRRMLGHLAEGRLDAALESVAIPSGEWCIRRLDVPVVLDFERPDPALESQWARALIDAVTAALRAGTSEVVHYARVGDALTDLLISVAARCFDREWAWRQIGLLGIGDPSPVSAPLEAVLCAAQKFPRDVVHALTVCVSEAGAASTHRMLGSRGWAEFARLAAAACGHAVPMPATKAMPLTRDLKAFHPEAVTSPAARLASAASETSTLAEAFTHCSIRADVEILWSWSGLIVAESDPSIFARTNAPEILEAICDQIKPSSSNDRGLVLPSTRPSGQVAALEGAAGSGAENLRPETIRNSATVRAARADAEPSSADPCADTEPPLVTLWAGLLFFLNTAADADIPQAILDDPALPDRPLWQTLQAIAQCLVPVAADDPAVRALSGRQEPSQSVRPFIATESARIERYASHWATVTASRIAEDGPDVEEMCTRVALRRGTLVAEPGWLDVHLAIEDVDVEARRAGLDLDPGWVPWLGMVVRFCYD